MTADTHARWAESLRVPPDATAEVAAAAFLRALPGDEFSPPAERVAAANALAGTLAPVGRDEAVEELHRAEVDAFAARFWSLAPAERLLVWSDLSRRGAAPGRLRELEPGLDVVAPVLSDPVAKELAGLVRELFVLAPRPRAIRRNAWLLAHAAEAEKWCAAHAALLTEAPALAALEPQLHRALEPVFGTALSAFAEGATAAPVQRTRMSAEVDVAGLADRLHHRHAGGPASGASWQVGGGVVIIVLVVLRVLFALISSGNSSSSPLPERSGYKAPAPPPFKERDTPPRTAFTRAEIAAFEQYELALRVQPGAAVAPGGYADWVRAGRPPATQPTAPQSTVYLNRETIEACLEYEQRKRTSRPALHFVWIAAGKPTEPGIYSYSSAVPPPR